MLAILFWIPFPNIPKSRFPFSLWLCIEIMRSSVISSKQPTTLPRFSHWIKHVAPILNHSRMPHCTLASWNSGPLNILQCPEMEGALEDLLWDKDSFELWNLSDGLLLTLGALPGPYSDQLPGAGFYLLCFHSLLPKADGSLLQVNSSKNFPSTPPPRALNPAGTGELNTWFPRPGRFWSVAFIF